MDWSKAFRKGLELFTKDEFSVDLNTKKSKLNCSYWFDKYIILKDNSHETKDKENNNSNNNNNNNNNNNDNNKFELEVSKKRKYTGYEEEDIDLVNSKKICNQSNSIMSLKLDNPTLHQDNLMHIEIVENNNNSNNNNNNNNNNNDNSISLNLGNSTFHQDNLMHENNNNNKNNNINNNNINNNNNNNDTSTKLLFRSHSMNTVYSFILLNSNLKLAQLQKKVDSIFSDLRQSTF
jgi:hypothetical protein